jgi:hypothetical protein
VRLAREVLRIEEVALDVGKVALASVGARRFWSPWSQPVVFLTAINGL